MQHLLTIEQLRSFSSVAPLLAALIAPLSTLLDIPGLTEPWLLRDGVSLPDQRANVVLSAVGLFFNFLANGLLIVRFSARNWWWAAAITASVLCWFVKFAVAVVNIIAFGLASHKPQTTYGEGFWCAVVSLLASSLILLLLLLHYTFRFHASKDPPTSRQLHLRAAGRHFMLQNTLFVVLMGLMGLAMSRIEGWTYPQGIYFATATFLTVGLGDFSPTKPASQALLFPFALVGIAQLANLIGMIASFFHSRTVSRVALRNAEFEQKWQEEENLLSREPSLEREVRFLQSLTRIESRWKMLNDLGVILGTFLTFWLLGALIFSQTESWTYGQGLYFCYVFFFAIGYGDYAPISPAGRTIFIVYSLIAVPIMTAFAVQTITQVFRKLSDRRLDKRRVKLGISTDGTGGKNSNEMNDPIAAPTHRPSNAKDEGGADEDKGLSVGIRTRLEENESRRWIVSHDNFVSLGHEKIEARVSQAATDGRLGKVEDENRILTEHILELAVEMERRARRLLVAHMEDGSSGQILLKADRSVQLRDVRALVGQIEKAEQSTGGHGLTQVMQKFVPEGAELGSAPHSLSEKETLEEVWKYRESFAGLLAAGSRLMKLKGKERFLFERRRQEQQGSG